MLWCWFLNATERNRMADGRAVTRKEAMAAFRKTFETLPDNMVGRST